MFFPNPKFPLYAKKENTTPKPIMMPAVEIKLSGVTISFTHNTKYQYVDRQEKSSKS
jgi:hypothetical protein